MPESTVNKKRIKTDRYSSKADLVQAFARVLAPLIRILLKYGVSFREFSDLSKTVFVKVAGSELQIGQLPPSIPRLSIVCGLSRKECQAIVEQEQKRQRDLATNTNRAARVLEAWHTDPRFMGPYGFPRDLKLTDRSQSSATFENLVDEVGGGIAANEMLDLLLGSGAAVSIDDGGAVRVLQRTFIPNEMTPEMVQIFTEATSRYMEVVSHNLTTEDASTKRFDRFVYPDPPLTSVDIDRFQVEMRDYLEGVVAEIEQRISKYPRSIANINMENQPLGVGLYFFRATKHQEGEVTE